MRVALAALTALLIFVSSASASGSVVLTNSTWICSGAVDLDLVSVTFNDGSGSDGLSLRTACTGHVHEIYVETNAADAVKHQNSSSNPVHDFVVDTGKIICNGHPSGAHQDGIQAMAGMRVTYHDVFWDCATAVSNIRISKAGGMVTTPTDVVCDGCVVKGPGVVIGFSIRSGIRNSFLCGGASISITQAAVDPINENNVSLPSNDPICQGDQPPPDTDPPPVPSIDSAPANPTNTASGSFSFSDSEQGVTFECSYDGGAYSSCSSPSSFGPLADGSHSFAVLAKDAAQNASQPANYSWVIDTTPPPAPTISSGPPAFTTSTSATFVFSDSEQGVAFTCSLDGGAYVSCSSPKTYTNLALGQHSFGVKATDAVGNVSAAATWSWKRCGLGPC